MNGTPHLLESTGTVLRHAVRLLHASTGAPLAGLAAQLDPPVPGWGVRTTSDTVVVTARTGWPEPTSSPELAVTVTDAATASRLVLPAVPGRPPATVRVPLGAERIDVALHPVPMVLQVRLLDPATGAPRTGATVTARATSGPSPRPSLEAPEADPGTYRTAAVEFTADFNPLDLLVDGQPLRTLSLDFATTTTRIRLVDTT
ncbi:hypothetical protein [Arthrobacter sp. JSM 101049]|uniref:hypothetical protein n=1 Tax=Arthrobacter sp. JSM 101049 TaxID=929097 RepID=UPI00356A1B04